MDQQVAQQIEQQIKQQWDQVCQRILNQFTTVSRSDLDAARSADDLVRRIADKSHFSPNYVETEVTALVLTGASAQNPQQAQQSQFGQSSQQNQPLSQQR